MCALKRKVSRLRDWNRIDIELEAKLVSAGLEKKSISITRLKQPDNLELLSAGAALEKKSISITRLKRKLETGCPPHAAAPWKEKYLDYEIETKLL